MFNSQFSLNQMNNVPTNSRRQDAPLDLVPGVNVGNIFRQAVNPGADYDIFGGVTLSNRPGQYQINTPWTAPGPTTAAAPSMPSTTNNNLDAPTTTIEQQVAAQRAAQAAQQQAAYDTYANQANDALARALKAFNDARGNIGGQYDTRNNELLSGRDQTQANVDQQRTQNQQSLQSNRNQIRDNASQGLRSLLAALGAQGAGGSSAALYLAPEAVQNMASAQRSGANQTFGENQQSIDTSWQNYLNGFNNEKKKLDDWKTNNERQAQADYEFTAKSLNDILAGIRGRIQAPEAFGSQIAGIAGGIPNTIAQARTYTGETPTYTPASLASYQAAIGPSAQVANQQPMDSNMPWLNTILNRDKDKKGNLSVV